MKRLIKTIVLIIGIISLLCTQSCLSQDKKQQYPSQISEKAKVLRNLYSKAEIDNQYQKQFFEAFPASFSLFCQLYGYDEKGKLNILYEESLPHIRLFCGLDDIVDKEKYYKKLISLGINGHWQADAVNYLQHWTLKKVKENLPLTIATLENYSDEEIKSFWYFLFDGHHPSETIPIDISKVRNTSNHIADLAKEAFLKVHKNAEPHGQ